jgi:hypothetical protein
LLIWQFNGSNYGIIWICWLVKRLSRDDLAFYIWLKKQTENMKKNKKPQFDQYTRLKETGLCSRALTLAEDLTGKKIDHLTIFDLSKYSEEELKNQRNIGYKTIADIKNLLSSVGLSLDKYDHDNFSVDNKKAILFILSRLHKLEKQKKSKTKDFLNWLRENNLLAE